ncbi:MAG: XrtA system polysaccharide deacetylase [Candidatus Melainabacteria bacterium]
MVRNALSIDVEEYFQVTGLENAVPRDAWETIPSRLNIGMDCVLEILSRRGVKATFFFLGWVAERFPELVQTVAREGHEIGIHGYDHTLIYRQTPAEFEDHMTRALTAVRAVYDGAIAGFRAPTFSIIKETLWALDILKKLDFEYDSSIFPFARKRYGIEGHSTRPYRLENGLVEFPMSTVTVLGKTLPVGGGGYFRLYPYQLTRLALTHLNRKEQQPAMVYLHPWEFDPGQPRVTADAGNTFRHRVNLDKTASRLDRLCQDFEFTTVCNVLKEVPLT